MITIDILRKAGLPDEMIVRVLELEQSERLDKVREQTRVRVARYRLRNASNDRNALPTLPPLHDEKPNEIKEQAPPPEKPTYIDSSSTSSESKKVSKKERKIYIPADFELNAADLAACAELNWQSTKISAELLRFKDHAAQNGRQCVDWHAAWRSWVRSPYQTNQTNGGMNGHAHQPRKSAADVARELVERTSREASFDFDRMLPQSGRRGP